MLVYVRNGKLYNSKNKQIELSSISDGTYNLIPERNLSLNDNWKAKVRALGEYLGWESFTEFEKHVKRELFGEELKTSEMSNEQLQGAIFKLEAWASGEHSFTFNNKINLFT